jgi:hypothetical protein
MLVEKKRPIDRLAICCLLGGTVPIFDRNLIKSGVKARVFEVPIFGEKKIDSLPIEFF